MNPFIKPYLIKPIFLWKCRAGQGEKKGRYNEPDEDGKNENELSQGKFFAMIRGREDFGTLELGNWKISTSNKQLLLCKL
jgi:hypothetical protein